MSQRGRSRPFERPARIGQEVRALIALASSQNKSTGKRSRRAHWSTAGGKKRSAAHLAQCRRPLILAGLLVAAILAVYWDAWRFAFVLLDDPMFASDNARVQQGITWANLQWSFAEFHYGNWVPLAWLSLMLDTSLFGFRPGAFHATNLILHAVNSLLLYLVLARATQNWTRSAFVAALFAIHPLHVESVAWIAERRDVLSILFGLLSLLAYVRYATSGRRRVLMVSLICFVCSLMSKQTLVTLPFVFLLFDFWPLGRLDLPAKLNAWTAKPAASEANVGPSANAPLPIDRPQPLRLLVEKLPFLAASAVFSAIAVLAQIHGRAFVSLMSLPLGVRSANAVVVYVVYLWKTLLPENLAVFYPHSLGAISWPTVIGAAALLLTISLIAVIWARRYPFLFVGWYWYLGTLLPMIGIVQVGNQRMADRYTYFPLIGIFLAAAWLIPELVGAGARAKLILSTAAITSLALLGAAAFVQVRCWQNSVLLCRHALASGQNSPLAHSVLGYALVKQGQTGKGSAPLVREGIEHLETAVRMSPYDAQTQFNLAVGLQSIGQLDAAAEHYRDALKINERESESHNNLAVLLCQRGDYAAAKLHLRRAIEINPDLVKAYVNLGTLCEETGDHVGAIQYSQRALDFDPTLIRCQFNIALALRAQGHLPEAISRLRSLFRLSPNDPEISEELAKTLAMQGRSSSQ